MTKALGSPSQRLEALAVAGFAAFVILVATLHILRPDLDPLRHTMSEYASGEFGGLMVTAFMAFAVGLGSLTVCYMRSIHRPLRSRLVTLLLVSATVGIALSGLFPTDLPGEVPTPAGTVHSVASFIALLGVPLALLLLLRRMRGAPDWQPTYRRASVLGFLSIVGFLCWIPFLTTAGLEGLGQRIYVGLLIIWLIQTAIGLRCWRHVSPGTG